MAEASVYNTSYDAGDDEFFDLSFDVDITGWTIYFELKKHSSPVISLEVTDHDDPVNGETGFTLSSDQTEQLDGRYYYEIRYENAQGQDQTFLKGKMSFT